ncbi:MAG TPA: acyl-CoA dehydrogenase [Candidatus Dormibacteraeota bacterium]|jgi:alkylation response protein AidB-like acyl-CoA dehydrogenase|nr:acyl-CoA dehydrogenase [Candidatus Dormibacteraeota bacterium]
MDFDESSEDAAFRDEIRTWLAEHKQEMADTKRVPGDTPREEYAKFRDWERTLFDGGWAGIAWPKEYGGRGASLYQQAVFTEEYAQANGPERINRLGLGLLAPTLMIYGTEEQKQAHLSKTLSGDEVWCQGFSEPGAGSDLAALRTKAVREGDEYVINGQKVWTSFAQAADWIFLLVRTDPDAPKHKGITYILVDMKSPGIEVRPIVQITGYQGETGFCETFFTDVRVPASNVVGKVNDGWKVAMATLGFERGTGLGSAAAFKALLDRVVDITLHEPRYDGIAADDPDIRRRIAQGFIETRVYELNTKRVLSKLAKGDALGSEASLSKLYWSEMDARLFELGNDALGPRAELARDAADAESGGKWFGEYLYARASMIYAGTSEIQKNIIAQRVLGLPRS